MSILGDLVAHYEVWNSWADKATSPAEDAILKAALNAKGEIYVFSPEQIGECVQIGPRMYLDETNPALRATYLEALEKLYRRGLVRHEGGCLLGLSGSGFEAARSLR